MRTITETTTVNVYTFPELSEDIQEKVTQDFFDVNVDFEWWESIYDEAENLGVHLTGFDEHKATGELRESPEDVADNILKDCTEESSLFQDATNYKDEVSRLPILDADSPEVTLDDLTAYDEEYEDLSNNFLFGLLESYRILLRTEYEYLTSADAIADFINSNEYEFTIDGEPYQPRPNSTFTVVE